MLVEKESGEGGREGVVEFRDRSINAIIIERIARPDPGNVKTLAIWVYYYTSSCKFYVFKCKTAAK